MAAFVRCRPACWLREPLGALLQALAVAFAAGSLLRLTVAAAASPLDAPVLSLITVPRFSATLAQRVDLLGLFFAWGGLLGVAVPIVAAAWFPPGRSSTRFGSAAALFASGSAQFVFLSADIFAQFTGLMVMLVMGTAATFGPNEDIRGGGLIHLAARLTTEVAAALGVLGLAVAAVAATAGSALAPAVTPGALGWAPVATAGLGALLLARVYPVHGVSQSVTLSCSWQRAWHRFAPLVGVALLFRIAAVAGPSFDSGARVAILFVGLASTVFAAASGMRATDIGSWFDRTVAADVGLALVAIAVGTPDPLLAALLVLYGRVASGIALDAADGALRSGQLAEPTAFERLAVPGGVLAFGAVAGFPLLPGYVARVIILTALLQRGAWVAALLVVVGLALLTGSGMRALAQNLSPGAARLARTTDTTHPSLAVLAVVPVVIVSLLPASFPALVGSAVEAGIRVTAPPAHQLAFLAWGLAFVGWVAGYALGTAAIPQPGGPRLGRSRDALGLLIDPVPLMAPVGTSLLSLVQQIARVGRAVEETRYVPGALFLAIVVTLAFVHL
ncbi:MAG: hypothetical protein HYY04_08445 [Chloroflexi bacterium]|nr:hypothetical protein [Chloroflexota bacterium]